MMILDRSAGDRMSEQTRADVTRVPRKGARARVVALKLHAVSPRCAGANNVLTTRKYAEHFWSCMSVYCYALSFV